MHEHTVDTKEVVSLCSSVASAELTHLYHSNIAKQITEQINLLKGTVVLIVCNY